MVMDTIKGKQSVLKLFYTSILRSEWRRRTFKNCIKNFFTKLHRIITCRRTYRIRNGSNDDLLLYNKILDILRAYYLDFIKLESIIAFNFYKNPIKSRYNGFISQKNNIFVKLLIKESYLPIEQFQQIITKNDIDLALDYIYEFYEKGETITSISNHIVKRKFILGVFISLFLFYCQALRSSSLENLSVLQFIYAVFGTKDS